MSTEERKHVMTQFSDGKVDIVCASDVAARGLDVKGIDLVVNYDMPHSGDDYLHRTGRTGRAGAQGPVKRARRRVPSSSAMQERSLLSQEHMLR